MRICVSRNIFHVHLNIIICTSRTLQQQKRTFQQKYSKFYDIKALYTTVFEHMAELFNHVNNLRPQTSEMTTGTLALMDQLAQPHRLSRTYTVLN